MKDFKRGLGITRREFMKYCGITAAGLGLSELGLFSNLSRAWASGKPTVLWLEGQDCAGCTMSFAGCLNPPVASLVLDKLSLRYHEAIMAGSGYVAEKALKDTVQSGGYILVVEGSIPTADDRFCMVGGKPFREKLEAASKNCVAIISAGACASFGGIPKEGPTGAVGVSEIVKDKPIINLPTCPVHTDHIVGVVLYFLTTGKLPELDDLGRPKIYFKDTVHYNCRRRSSFDEGNFLNDWNDPQQKNWCLLQRGCKGAMAHSDCSVRKWNDGTNFCLDCGSPCQGCSEPDFYGKMSPLYSDLGPKSKYIKAQREAGLIPAREV